MGCGAWGNRVGSMQEPSLLAGREFSRVRNSPRTLREPHPRPYNPAQVPRDENARFLCRALGGVVAGRTRISPHNPKVAGSNPAPATIITRASRAHPRSPLCFGARVGREILDHRYEHRVMLDANVGRGRAVPALLRRTPGFTCCRKWERSARCRQSGASPCGASLMVSYAVHDNPSRKSAPESRRDRGSRVPRPGG
jgi:hypothetical protein